MVAALDGNENREVGQEKPGDCQLNSGPFFQCCCNCQHHIPDFYHCTIHKDIKGEGGLCACTVQKGWVCAGFLSEPGCNKVTSDWPEHSVGCEMYMPIKKIEPPKWASCIYKYERENCRCSNADVRGCCELAA